MSISFGLRRSKYNNRRTSCGAHMHDSKKEAQRCQELQLSERGGLISALECEPKYELVVMGQKIAAFYPDFRYIEKGETVLEDCKSKPTKTSVYRIKKKLVKALFDLDVRET